MQRRARVTRMCDVCRTNTTMASTNYTTSTEVWGRPGKAHCQPPCPRPSCMPWPEGQLDIGPPSLPIPEGSPEKPFPRPLSLSPTSGRSQVDVHWLLTQDNKLQGDQCSQQLLREYPLNKTITLPATATHPLVPALPAHPGVFGMS